MRAAAMTLTSTRGFIAILLSVAVVQGQDGWGVTYTSTQICALKGSTVYMNCTYTSPVNAKITKTFWFTKSDGKFLDLKEDSNYNSRVTYICDAKNCSLKIIELKEMDSTQYKFRIISPQKLYFGPPGVNLSVIDRPHLQVHVSRSSCYSGDTCVQVELRCQSSCPLPDNYKYIWFKNMDTFQSDTSSYSTNISSEDKISCAVKGYETFRSPPVCEFTPQSSSNMSPFSGGFYLMHYNMTGCIY
uniref:Ig-like domain-containing protein n=1 Tax=Sphaeramia orbicularis TaxID=375764 RepID=A0A672YL99_9TELE